MILVEAPCINIPHQAQYTMCVCVAALFRLSVKYHIYQTGPDTIHHTKYMLLGKAGAIALPRP